MADKPNEIVNIINRILAQHEMILSRIGTPATIVAVTNKQDRERVFKMMEGRLKDGDYMPMLMNIKLDITDQDWKVKKEGETK
jgi:hypothetical protein